ncbi:Na(+)/H(+) antiporter subunit C [Bhargavaea beijingensis]|uniref:Multicomponent Na+:H+ antiporter subunit C n=1 Tax=Bhargavaea beijingensis TaxID=426756 RepID=A0A1G7H678_9BACL|nr:Na(+)/H(+) antiporter subunit C [Bhargavaea beijingensis]MCW1927713.1 Na(+)/H(+) antiporter subunit C [Bhargavaea beijingensis]RSK33370.1 Na(+)/H(+) antiporter subunit C [Bhargavaea beijingensis]SDE95896.1 multicomponent Na+:H+ antiporter subunit C [Bhargavaea beijingensis]
MEFHMTILVGILVTVAVYLLLSRNMVRIILGTAILSHAVHLLLITMGGAGEGKVPLLRESDGPYADALPQALILTAIVISFATTALLLVLAYRTYEESGSDNMNTIRRIDRE